jgi:hypothetical protein
MKRLITLFVLFAFLPFASGIIWIQPSRFTVAGGGGSGPVGQWLFNEGASSTAADSSGVGNDLTRFGGASWASGAATFDADASSFFAASTHIIPTGDFSITAWVNPTNLSGYYDIVTQYTGGDGGRLLFYINQTSGLLTLYIGAGVDSSGGVSSGSWQMVAVTRSGSTVTFYIGGSSSGTASLATDAQQSGTFKVGGIVDPYLGSIDDVRVYNRALSAGEITTLNAGGRQ